MKHILTYEELGNLGSRWQREAIDKIQRLAEATARYNGEIWTESAESLARSAKYRMALHRGSYVGIWDVRFATPPRVMPGTEDVSRRLRNR